MLIFCQNPLLSQTYLEILSEYKPVLVSKVEDLKNLLNPNELLIIDDDETLYNDLSQKKDSPVILFASKNIQDKTAFIQKPFGAQLLLEKVHLLNCWQEKGLFMNFTINGFTFCGQNRSVNGIPLTQREAELIELLYENKNRIVSKEEILQTVFGYTQQIQTHTLETHIYKLRQKIGDIQAKFIITKDGGYGLNNDCIKIKKNS